MWSCLDESLLDGPLSHLQVFEGVYNNARMLHFLTAVVVSRLSCFQWSLFQTGMIIHEKKMAVITPCDLQIG